MSEYISEKQKAEQDVQYWNERIRKLKAERQRVSQAIHEAECEIRKIDGFLAFKKEKR